MEFMKHSLKVYFFLLAQVLVIYSALHASDVDKKQKKLNKEFLDVAELVNITSRKKYKRLSTLLVKKADIAATREITIGFDKVQASALTLVMRAANVRNSNDNASIFFFFKTKVH
jgi:hypothetical protein